MKIILLGAGLVGGPMAIDLAKDNTFEVYTADIDSSTFEKFKDFPIQTIQTNLADTNNIGKLVKDFDMVVNAVPGFMGFQTLKAVIETGKNVVDIAFYPEDPFLLDKLAQKNNVTAVVDCGVSPGMSNMLIGNVDQFLDETDSVSILVGGLPQIREWPFEYKAVFSPMDVIEEYIRPARFVENGVLVTRPALSDPEYVDFPGLGTLESFNSDGLRTLVHTIEAPNLKEKTLRYPGHIEKMSILRETGFFDKTEIEIDGSLVRPIDFTAKLLFPKWQLKPGEGDITVMKVVITGQKGKKHLCYTYDLLDKYDSGTNTLSMARTTGYTATMMVRLLAEGLYMEKGIKPPEFIGKDSTCLDFVIKGLAQRGIVYKETIEEI